MFGIGDYFKRIKNSFAEEIFVRQAISSAIKDVTGGDVPIESIKIKSGTAFIDKASSSLKSTLFLKKNAILKRIEDKQNLKKIIDIK